MLPTIPRDLLERIVVLPHYSPLSCEYFVAPIPIQALANMLCCIEATGNSPRWLAGDTKDVADILAMGRLGNTMIQSLRGQGPIRGYLPMGSIVVWLLHAPKLHHRIVAANEDLSVYTEVGITR